MTTIATNHDLARKLAKVADLLENQGATAQRVGAWRAGAEAVAAEPRRAAELFATGGFAALDDLPHVGRGLAGVIAEILSTGHARILDRLEGEVSAVDILAELPGVGPVLARRIRRQLGIDTLEELEEAAHDGRLIQVHGFGDRRVRAVGELLVKRLGVRRRERLAPPPVSLILEVDRRYRELAAGGKLRTIAPRRLNPEGATWLPIMHDERDGWHFTALFSNTPLAHQLGKTHDWVVVYHDRDGGEGRATVVTESNGALAGRRVVRGREAETPPRMEPSYGAVVARM
jgi:DNA polymerase (family X)